MYNWRSNPAALDNTDYHFDCCRCNKEQEGENRGKSGGHNIRVSSYSFKDVRINIIGRAGASPPSRATGAIFLL